MNANYNNFRLTQYLYWMLFYSKALHFTCMTKFMRKKMYFTTDVNTGQCKGEQHD
jgi:hypothetical protein